jgi:hypothetical protein
VRLVIDGKQMPPAVDHGKTVVVTVGCPALDARARGA